MIEHVGAADRLAAGQHPHANRLLLLAIAYRVQLPADEADEMPHRLVLVGLAEHLGHQQARRVTLQQAQPRDQVENFGAVLVAAGVVAVERLREDVDEGFVEAHDGALRRYL